MYEKNGSKMWYLIIRVTDDPRRGGILQVDRVMGGVKETHKD